MKRPPIASTLRPLGLPQVLSTPDRQLDVAPLFDVLLILLMFVVLGSRFVLAPGMGIALPVSPEASLSGVATVDVMTVKSDDFIIFRETKYTLASLEKSIQTPAFKRPKEGAILLLRADKSVDMQTFLAISELSRMAGYAGVQLASKDPSATEAIFDEQQEPPSLFP